MKSSYLGRTLSDKQYTELADACDKILHLNSSNKAVIAENCLHLSRYSPSMYYFYNDLYLNNISRCFIFFAYSIRNIIFAIKKIIDSIFCTNPQVNQLNDHVDFLFISHYTSRKDEQKYLDSYFGEIIKRINLDKFKVVVAYINHTDKKLKRINVEKRVNTYILSNSINFMALMQIYKESLLAIFSLKTISSNCLSKRLSSKVGIELFSSATIQTQIIAYQIKNLVQTLSPKFLVTTYEGHSWERLSFCYSREVSPHIKCIGYQHAPIFKYQHAIKRGIGAIFDPDIILASGIISKRQLLSYEGLKNSRILLVGSGRRLSNLKKDNNNSIHSRTCLVAAEGTISECLILFGFALECAKRMNGINFLWRLPPQINFEMLKKNNSNFKELKKNIFITDSSLEEDIIKSDYVLYRGSSVVIQAVLHGLKPIYFMRDKELSMDPLFLYRANDRIVRNVDDFYKKTRKIQVRSDKLQKYCSDLYTNLNVSRLENL